MCLELIYKNSIQVNVISFDELRNILTKTIRFIQKYLKRKVPNFDSICYIALVSDVNQVKYLNKKIQILQILQPSLFWQH